MKNTNHYFRPLGLFIFLCLIPLWAFSQNISVKGVVQDQTGNPVIGASILQKGTGNGTISDIDGNFTLKIPSNSVISVSFVGYKTTEVSVAGRTQLNITLKDDTEVLDEVVVVGYGTVKKSDLTGATKALDANKTANVNPISVGQMLQGNVSGVQVINSSGEPGADIRIRIRGTNSINGGNEPLYVVDGFPTQEGLNAIAPSDISSMQILKDASATAIYGSRGANGVVIVTTKKGSKGKTQVMANASFGISSICKQLDVLNAYDMATMSNNMMKKAGNTPQYLTSCGDKYLKEC